MKTVCIYCLGLLLSFSLYASKTHVYVMRFENNTDSDYVVSKISRPVFGKTGSIYMVESADWTPLLIVKAHESGRKKILIRDPESFGAQIRLEPKNTALGLPTVYLKGGIKMSGSCQEFWWEGPYAIDIATSEQALAKAFDEYEVVKRVRYCAYRSAEATVQIYSDGIRIEELHNIKILDDQKVKLAVQKEEKS